MQDHKKIWQRLVLLEFLVFILVFLVLGQLARHYFTINEGPRGLIYTVIAFSALIYALVKLFGTCKNCGELKISGNHACQEK